MAVELHVNGTTAQVTAAINGVAASNYPGQPAQWARVQAAAIAEVNAFAPKTKFQVDISCHRDNTTSHISIRVAPQNLNSAGEVISVNATGNDDSPQ